MSFQFPPRLMKAKAAARTNVETGKLRKEIGMGYNITIGEADIFYDQDYLEVWIKAQITTHLDAPDHCPFTKKGNSRSPGYSAWHEFCKLAGIEELFYGGGWQSPGYAPCSDDFHRETGLLHDHPGAKAIGKHDADYLTHKLAEYRRNKPDAVPGFWDFGEHTNWKEVDNGTDPTLARLMWLEFWFRWAVENCQRPVVQNS